MKKPDARKRKGESGKMKRGFRGIVFRFILHNSSFRSHVALGCGADLTDTGQRKAHRADNDRGEQNQNYS